MKIHGISILLLAVLVFSAGCVSPDTQPTNIETTVEANVTQPSAPATIENATGVLKEFRIKESNYELSPEIIVANRGDLVRITLIDDDGTHNLFIDGYNVRSNTLARGEEQILEFVADKEGSFKFWCEVGNHRSRGMEGEFIVRPPK